MTHSQQSPHHALQSALMTFTPSDKLFQCNKMHHGPHWLTFSPSDNLRLYSNIQLFSYWLTFNPSAEISQCSNKHPVPHWLIISNAVPMKRSSSTTHSLQFTLFDIQSQYSSAATCTLVDTWPQWHYTWSRHPQLISSVSNILLKLQSTY